MAEYMDKEAFNKSVEERYCKPCKAAKKDYNGCRCRACWVDDMLDEVDCFQQSDVATVVHGRWELTAHSFYRDTFDESCELCVYIVANCSECSGKHPNSYQVYSKTLYAPEDADNDFRFNQKAEEEKTLLEFKQRKVEYANYCPNCGAKMNIKDGGDNDAKSM